MVSNTTAPCLCLIASHPILSMMQWASERRLWRALETPYWQGSCGRSWIPSACPTICQGTLIHCLVSVKTKEQFIHCLVSVSAGLPHLYSVSESTLTLIILSTLSQDEDAFFRDYAESHKKLSELGFTPPRSCLSSRSANKHKSLLVQAAAGLAVATAVVAWAYLCESNNKFI